MHRGWASPKPVAIKALGVAVNLRRFLDFEALCEEEEGGEEHGNVVGVDGDNHRSGLLGEPNSSVVVKVAGRANRDHLRVVDGVFDEGKELFVVVREDVGRDRVNCQLSSGWSLGKRKPGVITDGERLVEAAGEGIEIWGV